MATASGCCLGAPWPARRKARRSPVSAKPLTKDDGEDLPWQPLISVLARLGTARRRLQDHDTGKNAPENPYPVPAIIRGRRGPCKLQIQANGVPLARRASEGPRWRVGLTA